MRGARTVGLFFAFNGHHAYHSFLTRQVHIHIFSRLYILAAPRSISFFEYVIAPWAAVIGLRSQYGISNTCAYGNHNYNTYDSNIMQLYEQVDK